MDEAWEKHRKHILAALERCDGAYSEDHVLLGIRTGVYLLWSGEHSAIVTKINVYPNFTSIAFFLAGGELEELKVMERDITVLAKERGIQKAEIVGRAGWGILPGYRKIAVAYMKDL